MPSRTHSRLLRIVQRKSHFEDSTSATPKWTLDGLNWSACTCNLCCRREKCLSISVTGNYRALEAGHWELVQVEQEAQFVTDQDLQEASAFIPNSGAKDEMALLFRLGVLLDSTEKVKEVASLDHLPVEQEGQILYSAPAGRDLRM